MKDFAFDVIIRHLGLGVNNQNALPGDDFLFNLGKKVMLLFIIDVELEVVFIEVTHEDGIKIVV